MIDEKLVVEVVAQTFENSSVHPSRDGLELMEVHWLDLGTTEAIWVVRVDQWGPLTVAMDAHGNNLFQKVVIRARERLKEAFG